MSTHGKEVTLNANQRATICNVMREKLDRLYGKLDRVEKIAPQHYAIHPIKAGIAHRLSIIKDLGEEYIECN